MNWKILRLGLLVICVMGATAINHGQDVSSDLLGRINNLRSTLGIQGYALNGALGAAAQNHAEWMSTTGRVSHTQPDGSTPSSRAASYGYPSSAVSENIYMGSNATAETAWNWWLNSPIHYRGITNTAYTEVGIGSANGEYGRSFVLVFGNPNGWGAAPAQPNNSASNNSTGGDASGQSAAPAAPPVFVVGVDNSGNIMHEIQPGHTLGEIAFMYGYGWDDLEAIRVLNDMTEPEGRNLEVGSVLLIPPYEGTFTPTPGDPPTATPAPPSNTPEPTLSVATAQVAVVQSDALELQPTPEVAPNASDDMGVLASPEPTTEFTASTGQASPGATIPPTLTPAPATEVAWIAMTVTPNAVAIADAPANADAAPVAPQEVIVVEDNSPSTLLIVALVVQALIIAGGSFELLRRSRKS